MIVAVKLTVDGPSVLIDGATDFLRLLQVGDDQSSRPTQALGSRIFHSSVEVGSPDYAAEILCHEERKRVMTERWLATRDQLVEIGAAVSRRMIGRLEIGGVLCFRAGRRKSTQAIEMRLELPLYNGLANVCNRRRG